MITDNIDKESVIQERIAQANAAYADAVFLFENDRLTIAVNRIYYGMFYMLSALAVQYDFHTSKHHQLIGWFNKNFVKNGKIAPQYTKIINDAYENRSSGDYGVFVSFAKDDVAEMLMDMKDFLTRIEQYILSQP